MSVKQWPCNTPLRGPNAARSHRVRSNSVLRYKNERQRLMVGKRANDEFKQTEFSSCFSLRTRAVPVSQHARITPPSRASPALTCPPRRVAVEEVPRTAGGRLGLTAVHCHHGSSVVLAMSMVWWQSFRPKCRGPSASSHGQVDTCVWRASPCSPGCKGVVVAPLRA